MDLNQLSDAPSHLPGEEEAQDFTNYGRSFTSDIEGGDLECLRQLQKCTGQTICLCSRDKVSCIYKVNYIYIYIYIYKTNCNAFYITMKA